MPKSTEIWDKKKNWKQKTLAYFLIEFQLIHASKKCLAIICTKYFH